MPEFLGRPNTPNALAQTLVQLASAQTDPLAEGLKQVGKLADNYTAQQQQLKLLEKQNELQEKSADKQHGRAKELKQMDTDAEIYKTLLSNDRIVEGMIPKKPGLASLADMADSLGGSTAPRTSAAGPQGPVQRMSREPSGPAPVRTESGMVRNPEGVPLTEMGINRPGNVIPSKEKIQIDAAMAKKYKLPDNLIGKSMTMDQVLKLRGQDEGRGSRGGSRQDPDRLKLAEQIVNRNPDMLEADQPTRMAAIDAAYDALETIKGGGNIPAPAPKPAPEPKKGMSVFGFTWGGGETKPSAAAPAGDTKAQEEAIRKDYQSGKITKEAARAKIEALRKKK